MEQKRTKSEQRWFSIRDDLVTKYLKNRSLPATIQVGFVILLILGSVLSLMLVYGVHYNYSHQFKPSIKYINYLKNVINNLRRPSLGICDIYNKKHNITYELVNKLLFRMTKQYEKDIEEETQGYSMNFSIALNVSDMVTQKTAHLPPLLDNYRNPCWYEKIPEGFSYRDSTSSFYFSHFKTHPRDAHQAKWLNIFCPVEELTQFKLHFSKLRWRLRCFPRFFLLGFPKCGTTDLSWIMSHHSYIINTGIREPKFWSHYRFNQDTNRTLALSDYLDLFDHSAQKLRRQSNYSDELERDYHPGIIGDYDSTTICNHLNTTPSVDLKEPKKTSASLIRNVYPEARFIVMLRDPVDRFLSHYQLFAPHMNETNKDFHHTVRSLIEGVETCASIYNIRHCAYHLVGGAKSLTNGFYAIFLEDWMKLFPREQFLIIKSEDYFENRKKIVNQVFEFLGIDDNIPEKMGRFIRYSENFNESPKNIYLTEATIQLLRDFYRPFNKHLIRVLDSYRIRWNY